MIIDVLALRQKMYSFYIKLTQDGTFDRIDKQPAKGIYGPFARKYKLEQEKKQLTTPEEKFCINRRIEPNCA